MDTLYFFADFTNFIASISTTKPNSFIFQDFPIKWKCTITNNTIIIILASNLDFKFIKNDIKLDKRIIPLLKSNLQKQIRRQLNSSFKTCKQLLEINPFELFRRLTIISFEDVIPNVHTSLVCWLMAATSKHLVINKLIKTFTFNYINLLLENKEYIPENIINSTNINLTLNIIDKFNNNQKNIIKAIYFRTAYGGLKGDLIMINNVLYNYLETNTILKQYNKDYFKNNVYIKDSLKIHICSIDHHIYPAIIDFLYSKFNKKYEKELLKTIIWECNSKKNTRKNNSIKSEYKEIFNIIKVHLRLLQYNYLNKIIALN